MPKTQAKRGMSPRELDALRKQFVAEQKQADSASKWQLANDIVSGINDIVGRGVIAPILGMPGDINQAIYDAGAFVNNKIKDVEVATGMVKKPRYVQASQGNAYLGSEDIGSRMQQAGLVSSERRPMTELAASLVSPGAAAKTAINAPKTAMNMLRMVDNLDSPSSGVRNAQGMYIPRGQMGAIENLWHGSPHTFDRFDLSKMGTGEGAQAYGHGAYLAESPEVAKGYQEVLSGPHNRILGYDTKKALILDDALGDGSEWTYGRATGRSAANSLAYGMETYGSGHGSILDALADAKSRGWLADVEHPKFSEVTPDGQVDIADIENWKPTVGNQVIAYDPGNLYQTRLAWPDAREATDPLSPENFLDWDKPLSQQTVKDKVVQAFKARGFDDWQIESMLNRGITGEQANAYLGGINGSETGAKSLLDAGIPGIRYLDASSRGAGEGSRNYVVFDDKLIDIVSRNNQPIAKPVNVWHGTDIEFDTPKTPLFLGDRSIAEAYAADRAAASGFKPVVMGGTANFKKTATDADVKKVAESLGIEVENDMAFSVLDPNISGKGVSDRVITALKAKGFDSAHIDDFSPQDPFTLTKSYVAFDSNQLKLKKVDK